MSFITKRERVFNDYDLFDLPSRNEGKLKAYSSCTDARAWSHFCSDKSEHLVEIIKRNNEKCRTKYVPTEAIVNTLLSGKNAEIARLNRKIDEFEQMIAAYDHLELTCEQKCEIAKAHTAIKEANKELNELWFDLDLSGFTGADSDGFETGKSRGDERSRTRDDLDETTRSKGDELYFQPPRESKANQVEPNSLDCTCDASTNTNAVDPRIEELQECIISKDAKLNAMKNTIAMMENDVCEPYCIYAHIYTALEQILKILSQNEKYKLYLDLMTAGKDTRCLDIKGKIMFKLKVLEKFSMALIAPCSQDSEQGSEQECSCYRAEIFPNREETTYALTSAETQQPTIDNKRAQLVADIMEHEEMKEILSKENVSLKTENVTLDDIEIENYNADEENLKRLKNLQENYDDLMTCYEALQYKKGCLQIRCRKYQELEKEVENLQSQLREYNVLWNEKEHYRKRSEDLDSLKEQYLILYDETSSLETELKAEAEINSLKNKTIDELRSDNLALEKRLNEAAICFEKERNSVQCKIKECECTIMCQKQQIKSLSAQIDRLLEHDTDKIQSKQKDTPDIHLIDEINSLKEQINNLKDDLYCSEEEKLQLQKDYQNQLNLINDLKMEVEDWKSNYQKMHQRNEHLEKYAETFHDEENKLIEINNALLVDNKEKTVAIENLRNIINNKSLEVTKLMELINLRNQENSNLQIEIKNIQESNHSLSILNSEKNEALQIAKQESQALLEKVKDYDNLLQKQDSLTHSLLLQEEEYRHLKSIVTNTQEENENLRRELSNLENQNSYLLREIKKIQEINNKTVENLSTLQEDTDQYRLLLELTKKNSKILEEKLSKFEELSEQLEVLKISHTKLMKEKDNLFKDLTNKTTELDNAQQALQSAKKQSEDLLNKLHSSEILTGDLKKVEDSYKKIHSEQQQLQSMLDEKKLAYEKLLEAFNSLQQKYDKKYMEVNVLSEDLASLKQSYNNLLAENESLQTDLDNKSEEINNLSNHLEQKIEENRRLSQQMHKLQQNQKIIQNNMSSLEAENFSTKNTLTALRKESDELLDRVKYCESLKSEYEELKNDYDKVLAENKSLQKELKHKMAELKRLEQDNVALNSESQTFLTYSEDLEKALINARSAHGNATHSSDYTYEDMFKEIEEMKKEKLRNHLKIRELNDELDASINTIQELKEDILARDDRISILQNHINGLEEEVNRLHKSLAEVVDTGEQIRDNSYKKINESLQSMEAHHSKATHNMKIELAKLQNQNLRLEESLSASKIKSDESIKDKHKYISQIVNLQNEREIIAAEVKDIEMKSVGDSVLSPENHELENILSSINRIRRYLDVKAAKSSALEQTLQKVQNSYQLVQEKADEAKKIVEKEKQKILNEKEEAIRDRVKLEEQLLTLKDQLEKQDKNVIKGLEAEILNQKLIIDKLDKSRQNYISKLEDELQSLKNLYKNSFEKVSQLENNLRNVSEENNINLNLIQNINKQLSDKNEEVNNLKTELENVKNKIKYTASTQTLHFDQTNVYTQTNKDPEFFGRYENNEMEHSILNHSQNPFIKSQKDHAEPVNEIQVLTANVEPTFDYVKNSYLNYKLKHLSPGKVQQYSISGPSNDDILENEYTDSSGMRNTKNIQPDHSSETKNVIDIYNKRSLDTNSSKVFDNNHTTDVHKKSTDPTSRIKGVVTESLGTKSSLQHHTSNLFRSVSGLSTDDKDIFVIYNDSATNSYSNNPYNNMYWQTTGRSEILVEAVTIQPDKDIYDTKHKQIKHETESASFSYQDEDDDSVKQKLKIKVPRVDLDIPVIDTSSDVDKQSLDSYTLSIYPKPKNLHESKKVKGAHKTQRKRIRNYNTQSEHSMLKNETLPLESNYVSTEEENFVSHMNQAPDKMDKNDYSVPSDTTQVKNYSFKNTSLESTTVIKKNCNIESRHRLSRVDADVQLVTKKSHKQPRVELKMEDKRGHHGLDFIIDTTVVDPDSINMYSAAQRLRETHSDELLTNTNNNLSTGETNTSKLNVIKSLSIDYQSLSSKLSNKTQSKPEGFIMVKSDILKEYENRIKELTATLQNVEQDYKKKVDVIKIQYDNNIKNILNEHNEGVKNIQGLHEETLHDILKRHENEVENLRSMSIDAMKKAERLETENLCLKSKMQDSGLDNEPIRISTPEGKRRRRSRVDTKMLSKTDVEAYNVRPNNRSNGPCTCSLDVNLSDTIRNIFEQVDAEQRKMAEQTYLKYIATKILNSNVEALDCQELSFLHLKVCRIWKVKVTKEESLQKRIDTLEAELMNKQRHTQQNMADLDRKVAEERRRLQEVREAVCRNVTAASRYDSPDTEESYIPVPTSAFDKGILSCSCNADVEERRSAGDLAPTAVASYRSKRGKTDNRAVLARMDAEERREKKVYHDELPTRLRRAHDRPPLRSNKK